jgi:hypothetical protein
MGQHPPPGRPEHSDPLIPRPERPPPMTAIRTTVLIKRDPERNYDRLFAVVERSSLFGRRVAASLAERETDRGYEVDLAFLAPEVVEFLKARPKDFEIL